MAQSVLVLPLSAINIIFYIILMVYAAKVIKKDLKQSVYGSFFLANVFFSVPLQKLYISTRKK